jgi:hypothetical protein
MMFVLLSQRHLFQNHAFMKCKFLKSFLLISVQIARGVPPLHYGMEREATEKTAWGKKAGASSRTPNAVIYEVKYSTN